jgi:pimeloyl-ACP methyl ester carboxylesterase
MGPIYVPPLPTLGGKQLWGDVGLYAGYRIQRNVWTGHHRLLSPHDLRLAIGDFDACRAALDRIVAHTGARPTSRHLVVLLHGLFRSKDSFGPMVRALRAAGFEAHAVNYPSTRQSLQDHADQVEQLLEHARDVDTVSFVTHSMGGIVARVLLSRLDRPWRQRIAVNRLVMIGTPNRGAEAVVRLEQLPAALVEVVGGVALQQLRPLAAAAIPRPTVPFGVVAGSRGDPRGYNPLLSGDDDMTVRVEEALLDGAEDTLLVPVVHTVIMIHPTVVRATVRYLQTGSFAEAPPSPLVSSRPPAR